MSNPYDIQFTIGNAHIWEAGALITWLDLKKQKKNW